MIKNYPWFVNDEDGSLTGYAYLGLWKWRAAYRNTFEVTLYVEKNSTGKGIGRNLLEVLLKSLVKTIYIVSLEELHCQMKRALNYMKSFDLQNALTSPGLDISQANGSMLGTGKNI